MSVLNFNQCIGILLISFLSLTGYTEGTRELCPDSASSRSGLYFGSDYTPFGLINAPENFRLNIHINQSGESILFGLKAYGTLYNGQVLHYQLRKPDGSVAISGPCPHSPGQTGYIRYYAQANIGPFPAYGGYIPIEYQVTNIADTGNYYFEIINLPSLFYTVIDIWDFQVVTGQHQPALPQDTCNGRVWSQAWQVYAELGYSNLFFNGRFYVYSDDGIVTRLSFHSARVGAATIFCNPYGCLNTGNFLSDRQSVNHNTLDSFPDIAHYKVFLNNPDTALYPNGVYGEITGTPYMIPDTTFPPCSGERLIIVQVNKSGSVDITISFPPGSPFNLVSLFAYVNPGINYIPWDGNDGSGNPVTNGTTLTTTVRFVNGLTNLPIWDQETNPNGFTISLVRPVHPSVQVPLTYWDDTQLIPSGGWASCPVAPQGSNLTGCTPGSIPGTPGCHPWGVGCPDCHDKMINTWWFGNISETTCTEIFTTRPDSPVGHDSTRCGPGSVLLRASVPAGETVDWYADPLGGIPLLAGDTLFITPFINTTTSYYAEARIILTNCQSSGRTPVLATILPQSIPTITGPDTVCAGIPGNVYLTESGMTNYLWTVSPGGMITSGSGTNAITVSWYGSGSQTVSVFYSDSTACPPTEPTLFGVSVVPLPVPTITGEPVLCLNAPNNLFLTEPGMINYLWTVSEGGLITNGQGTNQVEVVFIEPGSQWVSVTYINAFGCITINPPVFAVEVQIPPAPSGIIDGIQDVCAGSTGIPYSVDPIPNAITYYWSLPLGATISTGLGTNLITVDFAINASSGMIRVFGANDCGNGEPSLPYPVTIHHSPVANAGSNGFICEGSIYPVESANASHYSGLIWLHNGSGSLVNDTTMFPVYYPAPGETGIITFTLVAQNPPCENDSSQTTLTIRPLPFGDAGEDQTTCGSMPVVPGNSTVGNAQSIYWTTSGTGTFNDPAILHPVYTPSSGDIADGSVILTLHVVGQEPCQGVQDDLILTLIKPAVIWAGSDASVCRDESFRIEEATALFATSLFWLTSGTGTFDDPFAINPTYFPGKEDFSNGQVSLQVTAFSTFPCSPASDSLELFFGRLPVANAGNDGSCCQGSDFVVTDAEVYHYRVINWTHNGSGTLQNANQINPTYLPPLWETGEVILTLTASGQPPCQNRVSADQKKLYIHQAPEVNAGPDQSIPYGSTTRLSGKAGGGSGSYTFQWQPEDLVSDFTSEHPETLPLTTDVAFSLMVQDQTTGCTGLDSIEVKVGPFHPSEECLNIHNYVTVNNDGLNDLWIIDCIENFPENTADIFNRWGVRVNGYKNYNNTTRVWDGTNFNGEFLPDGTYYYILRIQGGGTYSGWIFIRSGTD